MIEVQCECCGQTHLEPDPPENIRTVEQKRASERQWDQEFDRRNPNADITRINRVMGLLLPGKK